MARQRTTIPREVFAAGSLQGQIDLLEGFSPNATGTAKKDTLLGLRGCSAELARWLVSRGADVGARNVQDSTPLHARAFRWDDDAAALFELGADVHAVNRAGETPLHIASRGHQPGAVRALLAHGADPHLVDGRGRTALDATLLTASNAVIIAAEEIVRMLLAVGARPGSATRGHVEAMAERFAFHRKDTDFFRSAEPALARLCTLFGVEAPLRREVHDGTAPITVSPDLPPGEQYRHLWRSLVPSSGPAATLQGEAVRIAGRLGHEILGNGGVNWGPGYTKMVDVWTRIIATGAPVAPAVEERIARALAGGLRAGRADADGIRALEDGAVAWVRANPDPEPLGGAGGGPPPSAR